MTKTAPFLAGLLAFATLATAQAPQTLLFTGRFPFVSFDSVNEPAGGEITKLSEFEVRP